MGQQFQLQAFAGGFQAGFVGCAQGGIGFQTVEHFQQFDVSGVFGQLCQQLVRVFAPAALAFAIHFIGHEIAGLGHADPVAAFLFQLYVKHAAGVHPGGVVHGGGLAVGAGDLQTVDGVGPLETEDLIGNAGVHGNPLGLGHGGMAGQ